jgi:hypothetical protein
VRLMLLGERRLTTWGRSSSSLAGERSGEGVTGAYEVDFFLLELQKRGVSSECEDCR